MPPFLAVFMSKEGVPITIGLFTLEEFDARFTAAKTNTSWAVVLNSETGNTVRRYSNTDKTDEKTI